MDTLDLMKRIEPAYLGGDRKRAADVSRLGDPDHALRSGIEQQKKSRVLRHGDQIQPGPSTVDPPRSAHAAEKPERSGIALAQTIEHVQPHGRVRFVRRCRNSLRHRLFHCSSDPDAREAVW